MLAPTLCFFLSITKFQSKIHHLNFNPPILGELFILHSPNHNQFYNSGNILSLVVYLNVCWSLVGKSQVYAVVHHGSIPPQVSISDQLGFVRSTDSNKEFEIFPLSNTPIYSSLQLYAHETDLIQFFLNPHSCFQELKKSSSTMVKYFDKLFTQ